MSFQNGVYEDFLMKFIFDLISSDANWKGRNCFSVFRIFIMDVNDKGL